MTSPAPAETFPDWNEIWKQRQELHESSKISDDPSHNWNKKENAERYDRNARSEYDDRVRTTIAALGITQGSRVLDIGAGPGTLAIPLAPLAKEITVVEPGAGMAEILKRHAERDGIRNITCVQKTREEVDISRDLAGPYDSIIASLSLTCPSGSGCTPISGSPSTGARIIRGRKPTASSGSSTRWGSMPM
jgi:2-polyprenyl-3-methyl-5-hydroxy-6-metoxy-1,4-benzoquinol methylase